VADIFGFAVDTVPTRIIHFSDDDLLELGTQGNKEAFGKLLEPNTMSPVV